MFLYGVRQPSLMSKNTLGKGEEYVYSLSRHRANRKRKKKKKKNHAHPSA